MVSRRVSLALFIGVCLTAAIAAPASGAHHEAPSAKPGASAKPLPAGAAGAIEVHGRVFNGTLNRPASAGLEVRLIFIDGKNLRSLGATKTDASGRFAFTGVQPLEGGKGHLLTVTQYRGVPYMVLASKDGKEGRLPIFEVTGDPKGMTVERHQILVRYEEGRLVFREALLLSNTGTATFRAKSGKTLAISLPAGAEVLQPPTGLSPQGIRVLPGEVVSSDPLPPGRRQVSLVYALSDPPAQVPVETRFQFSTKRFEVMAPEFGMRLPSPSDLKYEGVFGEDLGNRAHIASKTNLPAGSRVRFTVSRDVESSFAETLFLAIAAVVVLGLTVPFVLRRRRLAKASTGERDKMSRPKRAGVSGADRPRAETASPPSTPSSPERAAESEWVRERSRTLCQIAALDDDWEAGKIPKEKYEKQRAELKRRALEISEKIEGK